jgi:hypothetical protein
MSMPRHGMQTASTAYKIVDSQVVVPASAAQRQGVQPVIALTVNGAARADVTAGEPITFTAVIEVPPSTGSITSAEWDFEGAGNYPLLEPLLDTHFSRLVLTKTYSFSKPGTYFPVLRVASQRQGDAKTAFARAANLGRVRVVVT